MFMTCQIYGQSGDEMMGFWARAVVHPNGKKQSEGTLGSTKSGFRREMQVYYPRNTLTRIYSCMYEYLQGCKRTKLFGLSQ
jgi:hypothetical protein